MPAPISRAALPRPAWLAGALLSLLLATAPPLQAVPTATCQGHCVSLGSIVHAAGVPPGVHQALEKISFDGSKLAAPAKDGLAQLAAEAKALPAKAVVTLKVAADSGLDAAAAKKQLSARVKSLSTGLRQVGLSARQFKVSAGP